ncbi:MAG TPA: ABC transporter permease [Actinomycetota bacterium]|nr:ABC transporter permease [Actinomycetota bacterium]
MAVSTRKAIHPPVSLHRASRLFRRNLLAYKHYWIAFVSGFFEPFFYLVAVGFGVGQFIDRVPYGHTEITYAAFLAPGLLAASTLNGAVFDGFFSPFFKLNWMKTYEGIMTTPVGIPDIAIGEIMWALMRGSIYGLGFLVVMLLMGLIHSAWAVFAVPAVMLSATALSSGAMILTGIAREISSLEKVMTLIVFPLFLFSGTFFPVALYPDYLRPVVEATPLFHSATLLRDLTTGQVGVGTAWHAAYLVTMCVVAGTVAIRLIRRRLVS